MKEQQTVTVIGLGYVGLPLAVLSAKKKYKVFGLEKTQKKVEKVNAGENFLADEFLEKHFKAGQITATTNASVIHESNIILVCVPTPVDKLYQPDLEPVRSAVRSIVENLNPKKKTLVVIESTINPGVCEEVVEPLFKEAGFEVGKHYELSHCPERINPGDPKWNVSNIPRVAGSFTKKGRDQTIAFYESILDAPVRPMQSIREAEATKIMENSFRDINIAFVNELAKSFTKLGIDVVDVINGAATKPFAFMPHWPSCGVGGHCIPVDPYYLIERAKQSGFDHKFLKLAREINNSMPEYTVEILQDLLNEKKMPLNGTPIAILGMAYKANVGDKRESPSFKIVDALKKHKANVLTFDPYLPENSTEKSLNDILKKAKAVVVATNHSAFTKLTAKDFEKNNILVVVDGKNCLKKESFEKSSVLYKGIGR
ncbi:MAG: nucleotide sugar dehydrogenase [Candidatus Moraniibacteriota bacterium]|nr:MAG: nucleotide sugar dehydrogenase [Candidatus Moranbacteria bacterium]